MQYFVAEDRIETRLRAIANDRRSGASELAVRSLGIFKLARPVPGLSAGGYRSGVRRLGRRLSRCRPAMAPIAGVAARLVYEFEREAARLKDTHEAHAVLRACATRLRAEIDGSIATMARALPRRFPRLDRFAVISYSSQVIGVLKALRRRPALVVVCESRPALEGRRTARLLADHVKAVRLITEAQIPTAIDDCQAALLGCDTIYDDGSILNKTGSYLLALAARKKKRAVIVLGDGYKIAPSGDKSAHESHPPTQVWTQAPDGVDVRNVCFEVVPGDLVDRILFEDGACGPSTLCKKAAMAAVYRNTLARR